MQLIDGACLYVTNQWLYLYARGNIRPHSSIRRHEPFSAIEWIGGSVGCDRVDLTLTVTEYVRAATVLKPIINVHIIDWRHTDDYAYAPNRRSNGRISYWWCASQ